MTVYVQGLSALAHYRSSSAKLDVESSPRDVRSLAHATSSLRSIVDAGIWRLGIGEPTPECPLEVLVRDGSQRSRSKAVRARAWAGPIALTAFRKVYRDIFVSSPEFVFLQMAIRLDLPELVALGMELCGTYRREVEVSKLGTNDTAHITTYQQQPLTTLKRLRGFVASMKGAPGHPKALKALEYVLPNSASPMETALYLLLCLPRRLGGYALPKPVLNPPITFSKAGRTHTLRSSGKPDLYWKDVKLDLEYNSDEFHGESQRAIDSMRRKALERMGIEVIELTEEELFSTELFHATVLRIALRFKKRIRPETEGGFINKRSSLRGRILVDTSEESLSKDSGDEANGAIVEFAVDQPEGVDYEIDYTDVWRDELSPDESWIDDLPADDSWLDELPADEYWSSDPAESEGTWAIDVVDWGDEGSHVFGALPQEEMGS